jgi:uridine phosphorylase
LTEKTCSFCGKKYVGAKSFYDVCPECRKTRAYPSRHYKKRLRYKTCVVCGKEFYGQRKSTTCKKCRKAAYQHKYYMNVTKLKRREAHAICRHE